MATLFFLILTLTIQYPRYIYTNDVKNLVDQKAAFKVTFFFLVKGPSTILHDMKANIIVIRQIRIENTY